MCVHEKSNASDPYPDWSGEPSMTHWSQPTTAAPGRDAAITAASGRRLGRVAIAAAPASPPSAAAAVPGRRASAIDSSHHAAAGTSLIGCTTWSSSTGLSAVSAAAVAPQARPPASVAIDPAAPTSSAPRTGTTQNTAPDARAFITAAMTKGYPGGQMGTDSPGWPGL